MFCFMGNPSGVRILFGMGIENLIMRHTDQVERENRKIGENMSELYDVIIIGAGPAGLSAAVYASRAGLNSLLLEKEYVSGGQIVTTTEVDNYLGLPGINGFDMAMKFREHAETAGTEFAVGKVTEIAREQDNWKIKTESEEYKTHAVVIATGASHRMLGIPGEWEFRGKGVSYCAVCDGAFFRGKTVAVIGGGDVAVSDVLFLARMCRKIYLIHRRDSLRAAKELTEKVKALENVEILWNTVAESIEGEETVETITVKQLPEKARKVLEVSGVFVAVGMQPNTEGFPQQLLEEDGYIVAGEDCRTKLSGIFAAGDVRTKPVRQIVTAVADGAAVMASVEEYLSK